MRTFSEILEIVMELPKEAMMGFKRLISTTKDNNQDTSTPAGAPLMGMDLLEKLGIPQIIDEVLGEPHTPLSLLKRNKEKEEKNRVNPSTGIVLAVLIADMISKPREVTRIYKIRDIAEKWHFFEILGIDPSKLNDDKILRSLGKVGLRGEIMNEILMKLTLKTGEEFDIPLDRVLLDSTVMELTGEFEKVTKIQPGRSLNAISQLITSLLVASNSKIPIGGFVFPGNTNDATTLPAAVDIINEIIPKVKQNSCVELIMDRIYITAKNVLFMRDNKKIKINWLGPLKSGLSEKKFRDLVSKGYEEKWWNKIEYRSKKEIERNEEPCLESFEARWVMTDKVKPELEDGQKRRPKGSIKNIEAEVRCIVYRDAKTAALEKANRAKRKDKLELELKDFSTKINKRNLKELKDCETRLDKVLMRYASLQECITFRLDEISETIIFEWEWNEEAYTELEKYDGVFALLTEYSPEEKNSNELIGLYRGRNEIEMNFRDLKGILELERLFLQEPERIEGYIFLKILAYYVLAFLRWYSSDKCNVKMTERTIQNSLGDINIIEGEFCASGITFCGVTGDSQFCKIIREEFKLSDPYQLIRELNQNSLDNFKIWVSKWHKEWDLEQNGIR